MNTQPISKLVKHDGEMLNVHSLFDTIQGEGPFAGVPAVFVRLSGCNLQCPSCDTEYTKGAVEMNVAQIIGHIADLRVRKMSRINLVVISGGEPFRQNISPLARDLISRGYQVQVETNGTLPPSPHFPTEATIVCAPKTGSINPQMRQRLDALKYVVKHGAVSASDGLPLTVLGHPCGQRIGVARPAAGDRYVPVFVQPQDDGDGNDVENRQNMAVAVNSCMDFGYRLCLQMHKYACIA